MRDSIINNTIDVELLTYERTIKRGEKKIVEAGLGKAGDKVKFYYGSNKIPVTNGNYDKKFYLDELQKMKREIDDIIIGESNTKQTKGSLNKSIKNEKRLTIMIGELSKSATEKMMFQIKEFKGVKFADVRIYFQPDSTKDEWKPTKKGITITKAKKSDFLNMIKKCLEEL